MAYQMDAAGERRLEGFIDGIGELLGSSRHRESFAMYAMGLLSESERKSMEPAVQQVAFDEPIELRALVEDAADLRQLACMFVLGKLWNERELSMYISPHRERLLVVVDVSQRPSTPGPALPVLLGFARRNSRLFSLTSSFRTRSS